MKRGSLRLPNKVRRPLGCLQVTAVFNFSLSLVHSNIRYYSGRADQHHWSIVWYPQARLGCLAGTYWVQGLHYTMLQERPKGAVVTQRTGHQTGTGLRGACSDCGVTYTIGILMCQSLTCLVQCHCHLVCSRTLASQYTGGPQGVGPRRCSIFRQYHQDSERREIAAEQEIYVNAKSGYLIIAI